MSTSLGCQKLPEELTVSTAHGAPGQQNQKAQDVGLWLFLQLVIGSLYLLMYDIIGQKFLQLFNRSYHTTAYHVT